MHLITTGRSCFVIMGIAVIAAWCGTHRSPAVEPPAPAPAPVATAMQPRFVGAWCNQDFATGGITRILIYIDGKDLKVHMWGRCHPRECDWGEVTATAVPKDGNSIAMTWNKGFNITTQTATLEVDGTLHLVNKTVYTDNSGRVPQTFQYVYENGLKHDWSDP
jgi:hypothetical protein